MALNRKQIIEQIKANIYYYGQFTKENPESDDYPAILAENAVNVLNEILEQAEKYDDVFDVRIQKINPQDFEML